MKYLAGIGMGKVPVFVPGAPGAGTLTFKQPLNKVGGVEVLVCVNTSTNDVLYNNNNSDNSGTFLGGGGTFDLVLTLDNSTVTMNSTDDIHAWIEIKDGAKGIDFMSDLVVKDKSYAAMKNIELSTESLTIDMTATTEAVVEGASATSNMIANAIGASTTDINEQLALKLDMTNTRLDNLLKVPDTRFMETGDKAEAGATIGSIGLPDKENIVSIRSMDPGTTITLGSTAGNYADVLPVYSLIKDDFIDISVKTIEVGGTGGKVLITVI